MNFSTNQLLERKASLISFKTTLETWAQKNRIEVQSNSKIPWTIKSRLTLFADYMKLNTLQSLSFFLKLSSLRIGIIKFRLFLKSLYKS